MKITEPRLDRRPDHILLSATIDGRELWYKFPPFVELVRLGDALLAASLLPAMLKGETLEIDPALPVSPGLLEKVKNLQEIFSTWHPILRRIEVRARAEAAKPAGGGVGCFYSGGVDSAYTLLNHEQEITHLIFVKGIDMQLENDVLWRESLLANQRVADHYGKTLLPIESNVRFFGGKPIGWHFYQGGGLASIALALGFRKAFTSATFTYQELFPLGTHPLTDTLWSTEATEIVHDGADVVRTDKIRRLTQAPTLLQNLRVCWSDSGYNCGRCEKCLRTMATLRALGVTTPTFPRLDSIAPIRRLKIESRANLTRAEENLRLASEAGDLALQRALRRSILLHHTRRWLLEVDRLMFSGKLKRLWSRLFE
jgi:hypothetical protein